MRSPDEDSEKRRLDRLAWWLDSSIPLPGTSFRFGLDALVGLLPGIGDLVGLGVSSYIVAQAARLGAPRALLGRMAVNIAIEAIVGTVPVLGDVFDAAWKANQRNVRLLADYMEKPVRTRRSSTLFLGVLILMLLVIVTVFAVIVYAILRWAFTTAF
jgi:hypothetical protein